MDALKIKFVDLPEDAQHKVLEQVGLASNMQTTTAQELDIKRGEAKIRAVGEMRAIDMDMAGEQEEAVEEPAEAMEEPQEQGLSQEDELLIQELTKRGYNDEQVAQAVQMMQQGLPNDQVIQALTAGGQNG